MANSLRESLRRSVIGLLVTLVLVLGVVSGLTGKAYAKVNVTCDQADGGTVSQVQGQWGSTRTTTPTSGYACE